MAAVLLYSLWVEPSTMVGLGPPFWGTQMNSEVTRMPWNEAQ